MCAFFFLLHNSHALKIAPYSANPHHQLSISTIRQQTLTDRRPVDPWGRRDERHFYPGENFISTSIPITYMQAPKSCRYKKDKQGNLTCCISFLLAPANGIRSYGLATN